MTDHKLFDLDADSRWRVAYDGNQWILQRREGKPGPKNTGFHGIGVDFVGSQKRILRRVIREAKITLACSSACRSER